MNTSFNISTEQDFKNQLEKLIDSKGMGYVLNQLIDICYLKSEHLAENWQDNNTASAWNSTANLISSRLAQIEKVCPLW